MKQLPATTLALLALALAPRANANEIVFAERFALATDRSAALAELIPGTEDYYYYHCLHYQNSEQYELVHETLAQWIKRYRYTPRVREIQNRQALLEYGTTPDKTLAHLRERLGLRFAHQKRQLDQKTNYPRALDQKTISWDALHERALREHQDLNGFEDSALETLAAGELNADRRRDLLRRLQRPDVPDLARLVVEDLRYKQSGGFGSHGIHDRMLLPQLDACLELMPDLIKVTNFINVYLTKLQPGADVDWRNDPGEKAAYLARLWSFVQRLPPAQNSLKAHVLFRQLTFDRARGVYDKARFLEYMKLPRNVGYINADYRNRPEHRNFPANLNADFRAYTQMPPVGQDEPLVRDFLQHFLLGADDVSEFDEYIEHNYLKELFAETKIVNGVGDMEQWYSLLPPARYQALKDRIDLGFLPTNPETYATDDEVALQIAVKNVRTLIVKRYDINTLNFYRERGREVSTDIDLDGLIANDERVVNYDHPPLLRHVETFAFPSIDKPGVYVIEIIGNGRSSRAVVRKGRLAFTERIGSAGHVFTVYDEANARLDDAVLWIAGHEYEADEHGEIAVPFSTSPGAQPMVISHGGFAALHHFSHLPEAYTLTAGIYVEREALVGGELAEVLVRPELSVNGRPIDVGLIEEPVLTITSVDHEGISSSAEVKGFVLYNDRESLHEFKVPQNLSDITFTLRGRIQVLTRDEKQELATSRHYGINAIEKTEKIAGLHLRHLATGYRIEALGKTGEILADYPVQAELKHRDFRKTVHATLQTDENGQVELGRLQDILFLTANGPDGTQYAWNLPGDAYAYASAAHGEVGAPLSIPFVEQPPASVREAVSLLETRGGTFVADRTDAVTLRDGFLVLDDLPAGDYDLFLKRNGVHIVVKLTAGRREGLQLLARDRFLELRDARPPLQIVGVEATISDGADGTEGELVVRLENWSPATRVHVAATRFVSRQNPFRQTGAPSWPGLAETRVPRPRSLYLSGRNIGDEYRYILERKYATKWPGNMLRRPSLLLNPWSPRSTETGRQLATEGEQWAAADKDAAMHMRRAAGKPGETAGYFAAEAASFETLDFLPAASVVLANLRPGEDGTVRVSADRLGAGRQFHVLALDAKAAAYRVVASAPAGEAPRDRRLVRPLPAGEHFTEQKNVTTVAAGDAFVVEDITTSSIEVYDSLARLYGLFATLSGNATLAEFGFLLGWADLEEEKRRELYARYACHELHLFLFHKDPAFFESVVLPYLRNKKDKTFVDDWLLERDLSPYLEPWAYGRLNIVERIMLAARVEQQAEATARHVADLYDLVPPDPERFNHLFKTALKSSALEADAKLDFLAVADELLEANGEVAATASRELASFGLRAEEKAKAAPPPPAMAKKLQAAAQESRRKAAEVFDDAAGNGLAMADYATDRARRSSVKRLYRQLDSTREWVENNYYHIPIHQQVASLVTVNGFWRDYAAAPGAKPVLSGSVAEASRSFTDMMLALAATDLPPQSGEHETTYEGARMTLTAESPAIIFHKEIREARAVEKAQLMMVSQNFFAFDDRYRHEGNERFDKFVTEEFRTKRVYGCQVVLTNPTSTRRKIDVLLQIPAGAVPVLNGFYTRSRHMRIEPYSTQTLEYYFYFPVAGGYVHYPVHVAQAETLIAYADPFTLNVVDKLTKIDKTSWPYLSQEGSTEDVLRYLRDENIDRLDLMLIAFRMRDKGVFQSVRDLLASRHVYNDVLWSYSVHHNDADAMREYLPHTPLAQQCGYYLASPLLELDAITRHAYEHKEYWPLVNARTYQLGKQRQILNRQFYEQYMQLMAALAYRPDLTQDDLLAVTVYLLLQDRVEEGINTFGRIARDGLEEAIQHDYLRAYLAFYREKPDEARDIAERYEDHPVDRWRNLFRDVLAQAKEIRGKAATVVDDEDRGQVQTGLADTETAFDFEIEDRKIAIQHQNAESCVINYYLMDIELLFSRNPFVQDVSGQFSIIHPNESTTVKLDGKRNTTTLDLPRKYHDSNVMVEITAGGKTKSQAYYPHSMGIQLMENYGQLRLSVGKSGEPLPKAYVKVYARMTDGRIAYYKDGYTDLRGRFDYSSLNTNELEGAERFAVLIMSDTHGSAVREARPPKM